MHYPHPQDLKMFMEAYRADGAAASYSVVQIDGEGYDPSNPGLDSCLGHCAGEDPGDDQHNVWRLRVDVPPGVCENFNTSATLL